ncbi:MAG: hypothetical protein IPH86_08435 [bacterium]|nr:hypothetical protein [bacterium]
MHPILPRGCTLVIEPLAGGGAATSGQVAVLARDGLPGRTAVLLRVGARAGDGRCQPPRGARRPATRSWAAWSAPRTSTPAARRGPRGSRRRAWRNLLRHWRGSLLGVAGDGDVN